MEKDWVMIKTTNSDVEVEFIKSVLEDAEIEVVVIDKRDLVYPSMGEVEIYTLLDDVIRAIRLIEETNDTK